MRYNNYKIVSELCNSVYEAVTYMHNEKNTELLQDCRDVVSVISSMINENKASASSEIIKLTDKINCILNSENIDFEKISSLKEDCENLKELCRTDINYKFRVLFVAELAGKWDSMESVYRAFKARNDCEVDVVIEPIFRSINLPEGKTRTETVYVDYLTPMGISHILYKDYDFEKMQPDITFISQPYESVTIPMFHPENIAKYSRLVYLPYFTALTINPRISSSYDSFFKLNTQKYSWKIACQSEIMKQYYKNAGSEKGRNIVVSGIPKWDYVIGKTKQDVAIPEKWKKRIDGRKVFLWNTHFTSTATSLIESVNAMVEIFENNSDIALIWRPHPMTETIIKVYQPEMHKDYLNTIKRVNAAQNIIVDTGESYLPAFVCSDAFITVFSSLLEQYLLTDKPILLSMNEPVSAAKRKFTTVDRLFDFSLIPMAHTTEEIKEFIDKIVSGEDEWREDRSKLIKQYFPNADGKTGERLADYLIDELIKEFETGTSENEIRIDKVLVVGNEELSDICVKQLKEKEINFCLCEEFSASDKNTAALCDINAEDFDLYIITEHDTSGIKEFLMNTKGIPESKIFCFWELYYANVPHMVCDKVFQNPDANDCEGIILGISHTEVGICEKKLKKKFCNIAVSSQDIYYQQKTLEYCIKTYPEKLRKLRYAIIDVYDYHYFNYNNSMSKVAVNYLKWGGYNLEPHNFNDNKNFNIKHEDIVDAIKKSKSEGISELNFDIWNAVFQDVYKHNGYKDFCKNFSEIDKRVKLVAPKEINAFEYDRSTISVIRKETIVENVTAFEKMLKMLYAVNPDIKIYTIIVPKFIETEALDAAGLSSHKGYFNNILADLQSKYNFTHLDFKEISDIALNKSYYFDAAHLNYFGALKLTKELNDIIFKDE